jgi:hypothetical protein
MSICWLGLGTCCFGPPCSGTVVNGLVQTGQSADYSRVPWSTPEGTGFATDGMEGAHKHATERVKHKTLSAVDDRG